MTYSISDLERLTGVQTHTIRIWERRYNALVPMRSAGNTRFYDDNQLRRLLNIVTLSKSGLKISHVCGLTEKEMNLLLEEEVTQSASPVEKFEYYISQLLSFGLSYDEYQFDELISKAIAEFGLKDTYINIMYPMLVRLGLMWRSDNICPAQEHFMSNIIRHKISAASEQVVLKQETGATWVLFLPEEDDHDIGLLFANFLLKSAGHKVIYLGSKVPVDSVRDVIDRVEVQHLLVFMIRTETATSVASYLEELSAAFKAQEIHVAGSSRILAEVEMKGNVKWMRSIDDLEEIIKELEHVN
jgi:DNA-binding transcriptional MerR regulator/methylmalonyl-CoA mutase cobalamin-binding subunit